MYKALLLTSSMEGGEVMLRFDGAGVCGTSTTNWVNGLTVIRPNQRRGMNPIVRCNEVAVLPPLQHIQTYFCIAFVIYWLALKKSVVKISCFFFVPGIFYNLRKLMLNKKKRYHHKTSEVTGSDKHLVSETKRYLRVNATEIRAS